MTGNPNKPLPTNWNDIPGAKGCTPQTCSIRDNYEELIKLNAIPIGLSTQSLEDINEMVLRLGVQYDVLSDYNFELLNLLHLPYFEVDNFKFIKRLTLIIENSIIQKVFYPIYPPELHINEILNWLQKN